MTKNFPLVVKVTWFLLIATSYAYCFYLVIFTLINYFEYNVNTIVEVLYENPLIFPAIDICNQSPYSYEKIDSHLTILAAFMGINFTNYTNKTSRDKIIAFLMQELEIKNRNGDLNAYLNYYYDTKANYSMDLFKYGFSLNEIVMDCSFKGVACNMSEFDVYHNFYYGNCYRFNSGLHGVGLKTTNLPGWNYGILQKKKFFFYSIL